MQDVQTVDSRPIETFVLNTGSPHYVKFTSEPISKLNLVNEAKSIRYNEEFSAQGINVNFINLLGLHKIAIRTYERGVEDETLSCGTGVTAAALSSAILNNLPNGTHTIDVISEGGNLKVTFTYNASNQSFSNVWLQGPATFVFSGVVEI